ncbi:MAG: hypothetical protein ACRDUY_05555 [Nitriliruptorales bacterium]
MGTPAAGRDAEAPATDADVGGARQRRRRLRTALDDLEDALARASRPREAWAQRVAEAFDRVVTAMEDHVAETEGPDGFFDQVVRDAPHVGQWVERLRREHDLMHAAARRLVNRVHSGIVSDDDVEELRTGGLDFIHLANEHRQRGADLLYDAYQVDIGGEH